MDTSIVISIIVTAPLVTVMAGRYIMWVDKVKKQKQEQMKRQQLETINFLNNCLEKFHRETDPNYDPKTFVPLEKRLRNTGRL
jgi:hypothetical protein